MPSLHAVDCTSRGVPIATPEPIRIAAKRALDAGATHYTDRPGISELREAIALHVSARNGIAVSPADEVLITCGVQEALFLALQVLTRPQDEVLIAGPADPADAELVRMVGATARVAATTDRLDLDMESFERLLSDATRIIFVRSPNAIGQLVSGTMTERIAALALERNLRVLAVHAGQMLAAEGSDIPSFGRVAGLGPKTVTVGAFSEAGLDAWRVGYLVAQRELMSPIRRLKQELSICSPAVSQFAALEAIAHFDAYAADAREALDARRGAAKITLEKAGLTYVAPDCGPHVFVRSPVAGGMVLCRSRRDDLDLQPADGCRNGAEGWLRLSLDHEPDRLARAIQELVPLMPEADGGNTQSEAVQ